MASSRNANVILHKQVLLPIHLHIVWSCIQAAKAELVRCDRDFMAQKT